MSDDLVYALRREGGINCLWAADHIKELDEQLQSAKQDAKEAEAYAGELEAVLESIKVRLAEKADRIEELEVKLVEAVVGVIKLRDEWYMRDLKQSDFDTTLAELEGGKDE